MRERDREEREKKGNGEMDGDDNSDARIRNKTQPAPDTVRDRQQATAAVAGDKQQMMQKKEREGREAREQQRQRGQRAIRVRRAWRVGQWYEREVSGKRAGKWLELGWVCLQSVVYAPDPASHGGMPGTGETGTTGNHEEDQGPLTHSQETDVVLQDEGEALLVGWCCLPFSAPPNSTSPLSFFSFLFLF